MAKREKVEEFSISDKQDIVSADDKWIIKLYVRSDYSGSHYKIKVKNRILHEGG